MHIKTLTPIQSLNKACHKATVSREEIFVSRVILINNFSNIGIEYE
jgi:hypothetical protein